MDPALLRAPLLGPAKLLTAAAVSPLGCRAPAEDAPLSSHPPAVLAMKPAELAMKREPPAVPPDCWLLPAAAAAAAAAAARICFSICHPRSHASSVSAAGWNNNEKHGCSNKSNTID
jgi:hypothetical protein